MTREQALDTLRHHLYGVGEQTYRERFEAIETLAEAERERKQLVALVRIGFLVTVDGERATPDFVQEPATRELLLKILQAKDTEAALR